MPTATAPAPAAPKTIRDFLAPNCFYSRNHLEQTIGNAPPRDALPDEIQQRRGAEGGPHEEFLGSEVVEWIENNNIDHFIPDPDERLFPEDVLNANQLYPPKLVEAWLGIPPGSLNQQTANRHPEIFTRQHGAGPHLKLLGSQVCQWIAEKRIAWSITPLGRKVYHKQQTAGLLDSQPPPPKSLADRAIDLLREQEQRNEEQERRWQENAWRRYLQLLLAGDGLADEAVQEFATIMRDLELSPEDVASDRRICERAIELADMHDSREAAGQKIGPALEARDAMRKRHEAEIREAQRALDDARLRAATCNEAGRKLAMLRTERPQLFTTTGVPPRLINPNEQQNEQEAVTAETSA